MKGLKELKLLVSNETSAGSYDEVQEIAEIQPRHICPSLNLISRSFHHFIHYVYVCQ